MLFRQIWSDAGINVSDAKAYKLCVNLSKKSNLFIVNILTLKRFRSHVHTICGTGFYRLHNIQTLLFLYTPRDDEVGGGGGEGREPEAVYLPVSLAHSYFCSLPPSPTIMYASVKVAYFGGGVLQGS